MASERRFDADQLNSVVMLVQIQSRARLMFAAREFRDDQPPTMPNQSPIAK
jgi:hypothetical protein